VDMLMVEPVARDRRGLVGVVVMVGDDDLDRRTKHLSAEILDRHLCRRFAAFAGQFGIRAAHVEDQAELDDAIRDPAARYPGAHGRRLSAGADGAEHRGDRYPSSPETAFSCHEASYGSS